MKKVYLIVLMAALLVLFGCAQPDPTSNAVSFSRSIESGEGASGSQQESFEAGDTTMLWAWSGEYAGRYDVASGVRSSFDGSTWSQDGAVYWNGEGEHTFIGASPALDITDPTAYGFDTPEDILWARTSASKSGGTVALEFSHAFAKLRFEIEYASCYDDYIEDAKASIFLADSGTMNFVGQTFSPDAGTTEVTLKNVSVDEESRTAVYEAIVIPQTVFTRGIKFNIHREGNAFEGTEETITLESNKVTTVKMDLDDHVLTYGGITVTDWEEVAGTGSAENPVLKGLTIVSESASNVMQDGETLQLTVVPVPATAKPGPVTWAVVEGPVAVYEDGRVNLKDGAASNSSAVVKATCDGLEAEITINIKPDYVVETNVWNIYTAQGLLAWHDSAEENSTSAKLMADITLPDPEEGKSNWTPIRNDNVSSMYQGTFDGGGHTISNIQIVSGDYATGFIGYLYGTVKNLTLSDCVINVDGQQATSTYYIGAVAGAFYTSGTIENCTVSDDVTISGSASGTTYAGGIAGTILSESGKISNCSSAATVSTTGSSYNYAGGIIGHLSYGVISRCSSSGMVTASGGSKGVHAGGITGNNGGTIAGCSSYADVTGNNAGGIAGTSTGVIIGCEYHSDSSEISTKSSGGGIVGHNNGKVISCWSTGNVTNAQGYSPSLGGIAGTNYATVATCYWESSITSVGTNYGTVSNTTKVDGSEGNTWADATSEMNDAITNWNRDNNNGCGYHFVQNAGSEPPVIAEGVPATT